LSGDSLMIWPIARAYSWLYGQVQDRFGRNIKGMGVIMRRIKTDREIDVAGFRWFFDHRIAGTYIRMAGGSPTEPETQSFLRFVADSLNEPVTFIDVGTNIGEMVVPMAAHKNVRRVIGFEPHPICGEVCRKNLALNALEADVRSMVVGDGSAQAYVVDPRYAPTSGIRRDLPDATRTPTVTLDDQLMGVSGTTILLIDVEGAELDVMKGGRNFIATHKPLVIFEYNYVNRALYGLDEVRAVLGEGYDVVRLRRDGRLDRDLEDTWNCVAIPRASIFATITEKRFAMR
jgi:FkbM family methyltransferase